MLPISSNFPTSPLSQRRILEDALWPKTTKNDPKTIVRWIPVRRDERFAAQHYIYAFNSGTGKDIGDILQLRPEGIHAPLVLKSGVQNSQITIDELKGKIYFIQSFAKTWTLETYSISLAAPDSTGFRRTFLTDEKPATPKLTFKFGPEGSNVLGPLFILPDGNLVWWIQVDKCNVSDSKLVRDPLRNRIASITLLPTPKVSYTPVFNLSHYPLHEFSLLKQNTKLLVHCRPHKLTPRAIDRSLFAFFDIKYQDSLLQVTGPIQCVQPDCDLIARPLRMFNDIFDTALLFGRGYKYWFVGFAENKEHKLLAVRSLQNKQNRQQIWSVQQDAAYKSAINKFVPDLMDRQVQLVNAWLYNAVYYANFEVDTQSRMLISVPLPFKFKDYRVCANCKRQERGKRKDSKGKRTAEFKVCRICKSLNLHLRWWKFGCHFCSKTCIDQAWTEHRKIHQ